MASPHWSSLVDSARNLDCIRCGLCLESCPTYRLTGRESASPRGRVHLMRALGEGTLAPDSDYVAELDSCLVCRRCESVCPAGVEFGAMMGHARAGAEQVRSQPLRRRLLRWLGFRALLPHRFALELVAILTRLGQRSGLLDLLPKRLLPGGGIPTIPPRSARRRLAPTTAPRGAQFERAIVLEGCLMPVLFGSVNQATAQGLAALGVTAIAPPKAGCCGSLQAHNGDVAQAQNLAKQLITSFEEGDFGQLPIVVNSAGCGSHMHEYAELFDPGDPWHSKATSFSKRVIDFTVFVAQRLERLDMASFGTRFKRMTWDDPCHLCHGQGVRSEPRQILDALSRAAALPLVELEDSEGCCGSAGIYSLLAPAMSTEILEGKLDALQATGADLLVTANPGCHLQWQLGIERRGLNVHVMHIAELFVQATRA